ncbi:hypothetical protein LXL04_004701 [Taraxacum kok-saghyz]
MYMAKKSIKGVWCNISKAINCLHEVNIDHQSIFTVDPVPLNVKSFIWHALLRRIPVNTNLTSRGINVQTDLCTLCGTEKETVDHLLIKCNVAEEVCEWIFKWCGITI